MSQVQNRNEFIFQQITNHIATLNEQIQNEYATIKVEQTKQLEMIQKIKNLQKDNVRLIEMKAQIDYIAYNYNKAFENKEEEKKKTKSLEEQIISLEEQNVELQEIILAIQLN
jgi:hypothetical protein